MHTRARINTLQPINTKFQLRVVPYQPIPNPDKPVLDPETSYETTINSLNIEHRRSNIEHRIMITLRFIDFKLNGAYTACGKPFGAKRKAEKVLRIEF